MYASFTAFPDDGKFATNATLPIKSTATPCAPVGPVTPCEPVGPVSPVAPVGPVGPVTPCAPVGPVMPCAPVGPVGPIGKIKLSVWFGAVPVIDAPALVLDDIEPIVKVLAAPVGPVTPDE